MRNFATETTTTMSARGVPLYLRFEDEGTGYLISDTVGLRYGSGPTIAEALDMWAEAVQTCLDEEEAKIGGHYAAECAAYRRELSAVPIRPRRGDVARRDKPEVEPLNRSEET